MLDVDFVRSQYPVFQRPESAAWAFFENAGGSYVPESVVDRLDAFFRWYKVQPYGPFESSIVAGEAMDAGYQCITELLNADDDEVTIGPSTSLNCYVLAQAFRPHLQPGDEVVVTNQDHEANIGCWERLSDTGAVIRRWQIDPVTGELSVDELSRLVNHRTDTPAGRRCAGNRPSTSIGSSLAAKSSRSSSCSCGEPFFAPVGDPAARDQETSLTRTGHGPNGGARRRRRECAAGHRSLTGRDSGCWRSAPAGRPGR